MTKRMSVSKQLVAYTAAISSWLEVAQLCDDDDVLAIMIQLGAPTVLSLNGKPAEKLNALKMVVRFWAGKASERQDPFAVSIATSAASLPQ